MQHWFSSSDLISKRNEIFKILTSIYENNVKNNLKFESDEDLTMKSDDVEIINNDNSNLLSDDEDTMS